jgi:hypothetical protein
LLILGPDAQLILETKVKLTDCLLLEEPLLACFYLFKYECGDLLDDINEGHRWAPVFLLFGDDVHQEVSPIGKRGRTELTAGY